jgi:hypothetical protein
MNKQKAETHIQQLGFFDDDLKTSKHDEIMIWLDENIQEAINTLFYKPFDDVEKQRLVNDTMQRSQRLLPILEKELRRSGKLEENKEKLQSLKDWDGSNVATPDTGHLTTLINRKVWEKTVLRENRNAGSKFTLGFIDLAVSYEMVYYYIAGVPVGVHQETDINQYQIPYIDYSWLGDNVYFEVKAKMPTLGELLRQINFYKDHLPGQYVVVSSDDRFKRILSEQGVGFLKAFSF